MVNAGNQRLQIVWGYWLKQQSMHACTGYAMFRACTPREGEEENTALCVAEEGRLGPDSEDHA